MAASDPVKRADNLTTHFPNHSSRELQTGTTKFEDDAKAVSWNDFASADFKFGQPGSINLNLAPKLDTAAANDKPHAHATLKKNGSLASRKSRKQQVVTDPQPPTQPPVDAPSPPAPSQLRTVKLTDVEDVFADVFLDAVAERDILAKWPTFAIAQLRKPLGGHRSENAQVRWLVVEEIEPIEATEPQEVIEREASPTRSAKSIAERYLSSSSLAFENPLTSDVSARAIDVDS